MHFIALIFYHHVMKYTFEDTLFSACALAE